MYIMQHWTYTVDEVTKALPFLGYLLPSCQKQMQQWKHAAEKVPNLMVVQFKYIKLFVNLI